MKKLSALTNLAFVTLLLQGCFSSDDNIINKDNVARKPAIDNSRMGVIAGAVSEKGSEIKFGPSVRDSEWHYADYRPAENLQLTALPKSDTSYSVGKDPKRGTIINSTPVLAEGKIFTLGGQGELTARDVNDPSKVLWETQAEKEYFKENKEDKDFYERLKKSIYDKNQFNGGNIAYSNGKVFVTTKRGNVFAFDAGNGELRWQRNFTVPVRTSPAIGDNKVIVGTFDDEIFALDEADGDILWKHSGLKEKSKYSTSPTPLIMGNKVIVGYSSGEVFALSMANGSPLWSTILGSGFTMSAFQSNINDIKYSPIYGEGKVFIVSGDGSLNAIDTDTGQKIWTYPSKIANAPWYSNGFVFAVTYDQKIIAVNAKNGAAVLSKTIITEADDELNISGPVIAEGKILVNDNKGNLYQISALDGSVENTVSIPKNIELPPVVAGGKVYFLSQKSNLIILQ
jgi:outer membrane protein assembly factor BamB